MKTSAIDIIISIIKPPPKPIAKFLREHFRRDLIKLPIVTAEFSRFRHPCMHKAMQKYLTGKDSSIRTIGISEHYNVSLAALINPMNASDYIEGPIKYETVASASSESNSYLAQALYLIRTPEHRFAVLWNVEESKLSVEVIARERKVAEKFLSELRTLADRHSVYREQIVSLTAARNIEFAVEFKELPAITRDSVILPDGLLEQIERHTIRFSEHKKALSSRGLHLKRGLLLHGPPGNGKSLIVMYLLANMPGRTTVIVNSTTIEYLKEACELARALQPATIVIDDVDLVAEERSRGLMNPLMFELLNQMDGLARDADVLFLLTTNRPEILEPAIAARPGRIDQAIQIPLPDEDCRRRLFALYTQELTTDCKDIDAIVQRTSGTSAAFMRELIRKAAVFTEEEGSGLAISDRHFSDALDELMAPNSLMTLSMLGCDSSAAERAERKAGRESPSRP